jgi:localization factor PodJL
MTSGAPWSVKGIDPKAREVAKDLARRSGMTLGEWLNQVIMDDGPGDPPPAPDYFGGLGRGAHPGGGATFGAAQAYGRFEAPQHPSDEVYRVTEALDRLSARIEAAEHRSTLAISGIDQSVSGLVSRLASAEREQTVVAARFEGAVDDLRVEHARVVERLRRIEQEAAGPRSVEALRAMEGALAKVASHLYDGEARTRETLQEMRRDLDGVSERLGPGGAVANVDLVDGVVARVAERLEQAEGRTTAAVRGLESSLAHLDDRLGAAEARIDGRTSDAGLEQLAASLSARVDAARLEMAEKIRATADGRFDRMERTLQEMTGHVQAAERRSASAIERMGHEVLRMADVLSRKVQDAEHRSADAIEQVGGEMARIANAMETRLDRVDGAGALALEKLGGEIARITERLAERIADAERRSAQAIDDVGDQMARFGERLQDRQERSSSELADRIRQSEERTARLLEDARERIDQRLAEAGKRAAPAPAAPDYADPTVAPFGQADLGAPPAPAYGFDTPRARGSAPAYGFDAPRSFEATPAFDSPPAAHAPDPFDAAEALELPAAHDDPIGFGEPPAFARAAAEDRATYDAALSEVDSRTFEAHAEPAIDPLDIAAEAPQADIDDDDDEQDADDALAIAATFAPQAREPAQPLSTRALIEQARAAARASSEDPAAAARARAKAAGAERKKAYRRNGSALQVALLASGTVAASSLALAGYIILAGRPDGPLPSRLVEALGQGSASAPKGPPAKEVAPPMLAMALAPQPVAGQTPAPPAVLGPAEPQPLAAAADGGPELYADGVQKIETHDPAGLDAVRKSANLGYAPAEFFLAKLYENGEAGVKKDPVEARLWTQRAADAGDRKAMHNLALYYFEGAGGEKNTTVAAQWFRHAAEAGLVDSQYNLGRLYEEGFGVAQNPAEAYKWYLIAGASGDGESRASAKRLKGELSPEAQAAAERAAQSFQAQATRPDGVAPAQASGQAGLANAQRALSHLGYYRGPSDGVPSPALKFAIAAFQRDKGLTVTGDLDPTVSPLLDAAAR